MRYPRLGPLLGVASVLAAIALWELTIRFGLLDANYFPPVSRIVPALGSEFRLGEMVGHLTATLVNWLRGFALAALVGVVGGVILGATAPLYAATRVTFEFLRPIPSAAIIPVAILLLGIDDAMRTAVVFYSTLWPVLFNTVYGIRAVEPGWVDAARTFGFSRHDILFRVMLPGALPYVTTGLRVGAGIALVVAITSEMITGAGGLGFYVSMMEQSMRVPEMYGGILLTGVLGYGLNNAFLYVEHRFVGWHRRSSGD